jgi:23S rRNA (uridine2552-2'-O)-methyltransferase
MQLSRVLYERGGAWHVKRARDRFADEAAAQGLRARSALKLQSILDKHRGVLRYGWRVVDLGAAPGGWSIVAADAVGAHGPGTSIDVRASAVVPRTTAGPLAGLQAIAAREAGVEGMVKDRGGGGGGGINPAKIHAAVGRHGGRGALRKAVSFQS